jgi:hypothetical protein
LLLAYLVAMMSACQCAPSGRLLTIPEALFVIPDYQTIQVGIACREIVK